MKTYSTIIALLTAFGVAAQSGQDRVMLQQIAALKIYGSYIKKGYGIAKDGLNFIGSVKNGELNLHQLFFEGLEEINPVIRQYPAVARILQVNAQIVSLQSKLEQQLENNLFYGNEKEYIRRVIGRVLAGCYEDMEDLQAILSENVVMADDAQRLARIDLLLIKIKDRYTFARSFYNDCVTLAGVRQKEVSDIRQSKILYNLNEAP